ncbi:MAG: prepilin peptidase [Kiritimatiellae bacterium]|nr:prepilin peptidase [Kiritimatiellia bacterium]
MMNCIRLLAVSLPLLALLCWYDIRYRRLPNVLVLALFCTGAGCRFFFEGVGGIADGLFGALAGAAFLFIPFMLRSAGGGDVKMLFACGMLTGIRYVVAQLLFVSLVGLSLAIVMLIAQRVSAARLRHYWLSVFSRKYDRKAGRENLLPKEDERGRIPFGIAIAVGTVVTFVWTYFTEAAR